MAAVLIIRTRPFTPEERSITEDTKGTHPVLHELCTSWASYKALGGNIARIRQTNALVARQAEELNLPVVVSIPGNIHHEVRDLGCIPAEYRDGDRGLCITWLDVDGAPVKEEKPPQAMVPFTVVARNHGTVIAEGWVFDRTGAQRLLELLKPQGGTNVDMLLTGTLIETLA